MTGVSRGCAQNQPENFNKSPRHGMIRPRIVFIRGYLRVARRFQEASPAGGFDEER